MALKLEQHFEYTESLQNTEQLSVNCFVSLSHFQINNSGVAQLLFSYSIPPPPFSEKLASCIQQSFLPRRKANFWKTFPHDSFLHFWFKFLKNIDGMPVRFKINVLPKVAQTLIHLQVPNRVTTLLILQNYYIDPVLIMLHQLQSILQFSVCFKGFDFSLLYALNYCSCTCTHELQYTQCNVHIGFTGKLILSHNYFLKK